MSSTTLALLGGTKAVTIENPEQWRPPIEREIELCNQIIRERSFSATNSGIPAQFEKGFKELVGTEFCLFTKKLPIYRDGRGPLSEDYIAYNEGDLPITEKIHPNIISFPALIEPEDGYIEQYVTAIRKVVDNYKQLL